MLKYLGTSNSNIFSVLFEAILLCLKNSSNKIQFFTSWCLKVDRVEYSLFLLLMFCCRKEADKSSLILGIIKVTQSSASILWTHYIVSIFQSLINNFFFFKFHKTRVLWVGHYRTTMISTEFFVQLFFKKYQQFMLTLPLFPSFGKHMTIYFWVYIFSDFYST